jgi:DNA-binding CsgD family transcriptional regulator
MPHRIVGREAEQSRIIEWLTSPTLGASANVLTGPAGAGKTALWDWTVGEAAGLVLVSRAGIAEAHLPWVCLADLLSTVPADQIDALPAPQRHALRVVMLLDAGDETVDARAVGTGVWTLLGRLCGHQPVLVALDDLPHVDPESAAALAFALRRLPDAAAIRVIGTSRADGPPWTPLDGIDAGQLIRLDIGPLTVAATYDLLYGRLGVRFPRPMLLRVHETSGGNPLYALELARALDRMDSPPAPGLPLPVPAGLDALIGDRIRSQPTQVRTLVASAAAAWRLAEPSVDTGVLAAATDAGLVVADVAIDGARVIRAAHPLIGAAAYASLTAGDRQALHERLAAVSGDPVERARHTALAGTTARGDVARILDAGVLAALASGTPEIAVELGRLAVDRSDDAEKAERLDRLAQALSRAGDAQGAVVAARAAADATPVGPARAIRQVRLAEHTYVESGHNGVLELLKAALEEAAGDPAATADVLVTLTMYTLDIETAVGYANRAVSLLEQLDEPDPGILVTALGMAAGMRFRAGGGLDHEAFERIIEIERVRPRRRLADRVDAAYAALLKYADHLTDAEARLLALLEEAEGSGDLEAVAYVLGHLPQIALWQGRLSDAQAYAERHLVIAEQAGMMVASTARYNLGVALAYRGRHDDAVTLLTMTMQEKNASDWDLQRGLGGLGYTALSSGDAALAVEHLTEWHTLLRAMNFREPGYSRSHLDFVEALVATGRIAQAEEFIDELDDQVLTSGRRSAAAIATTGRALIQACRGDIDSAAGTIQDALAYYETSPFRFDQARTCLIAGRIAWRARARRMARDLVASATDDFTAFGATAWAERGASELARMNLRAAAPAQLTETERRIADLAARGMTNRAIAEELFLATKTVEANIARAYRKLGIRSRAELGARLG